VARQGDIRIQLETLDEEGRAVGSVEGLEVHVQGGLPGETVAARIEHKSPHLARAWAALVEVETPSPDRVAPACRAHPRCGGCVLQCLGYPAQLAFKRERVARALGRDDVEEVVPSPRLTHYRNKAKYVLAGEDGRLVLGSYAPGTHRVVDMRGCEIPEPPGQALAEDVVDRLQRSGLPPYDERARTGELRYLVVRVNHAGESLVVVVTGTAAPRAALAALGVPLVHHVNATTGGALFAPTGSGDDDAVLGGTGVLVDRVGPVALELSARAFFQVNREQAARLYAHVASAASGRVADLYTGVGGIALTLAAAGADVLGIESHAPAIADARRSAEAMGLGGRARFEVGDAAALAAASRDFDAIVVNPPRKGLQAAARAALLRMSAPRVVYVSCGPESLATDLAALAPAYRAVRLSPFDLLPGTPHVETVAVLDRIR
jgi:23S rRNA (uracil1939-C5)-methyltransferase